MAGPLRGRRADGPARSGRDKEFEAISERGGVLGAMDTMHQRGKIQEESMYYSEFNQGRKKHDDSLAFIGAKNGVSFTYNRLNRCEASDARA